MSLARLNAAKHCRIQEDTKTGIRCHAPLVRCRYAPPAWLAALAAVWLAAGPVEGRVFQVRNLAGSASLFGSFPGWNLLSCDAVRVNGAPGSLEVWGCDEDFGKVLARLRGLPGLVSGFEAAKGDGAAAAVGLLRADGVTVRLAAIPGNRPGRCVVVALRQSDASAACASVPAAAANSAGIPALPGSRAVFSMEDSETRAGIDVSAVPGTAAAARAMAESALERTGWTRLFPGQGAVSGGMTVFTRGSDVCWVSVSAGAGQGEAVVTLLRKRMELE